MVDPFTVQVPAGTTILNTVTVAGDKIPDGYYITNAGDQFIENGVLTVYVRQNAEEVIVKIVDADTGAEVADSPMSPRATAAPLPTCL